MATGALPVRNTEDRPLASVDGVAALLLPAADDPHAPSVSSLACLGRKQLVERLPSLAHHRSMSVKVPLPTRAALGLLLWMVSPAAFAAPTGVEGVSVTIVDFKVDGKDSPRFGIETNDANASFSLQSAGLAPRELMGLSLGLRTSLRLDFEIANGSASPVAVSALKLAVCNSEGEVLDTDSHPQNPALKIAQGEKARVSVVLGGLFSDRTTKYLKDRLSSYDWREQDGFLQAVLGKFADQRVHVTYQGAEIQELSAIDHDQLVDLCLKLAKLERKLWNREDLAYELKQYEDNFYFDRNLYYITGESGSFRFEEERFEAITKLLQKLPAHLKRDADIWKIVGALYAEDRLSDIFGHWTTFDAGFFQKELAKYAPDSPVRLALMAKSAEYQEKIKIKEASEAWSMARAYFQSYEEAKIAAYVSDAVAYLRTIKSSNPNYRLAQGHLKILESELLKYKKSVAATNAAINAAIAKENKQFLAKCSKDQAVIFKQRGMPSSVTTNRMAQRTIVIWWYGYADYFAFANGKLVQVVTTD